MCIRDSTGTETVLPALTRPSAPTAGVNRTVETGSIAKPVFFERNVQEASTRVESGLTLALCLTVVVSL